MTPFSNLLKNKGKGIIVEPQKKVFSKRLKRTYRLEKNLVLENVAIAQKTGKRKLYKIAVSDSRWTTGLAAFEKWFWKSKSIAITLKPKQKKRI